MRSWEIFLVGVKRYNSFAFNSCPFGHVFCAIVFYVDMLASLNCHQIHLGFPLGLCLIKHQNLMFKLHFNILFHRTDPDGAHVTGSSPSCSAPLHAKLYHWVLVLAGYLIVTTLDQCVSIGWFTKNTQNMSPSMWRFSNNTYFRSHV
jgi:hypothetical protein